MNSRANSTGKFIWLVLVFAFTACVIAALLQGSVAYKRISGVLDREFGIHTGLSYVASRVHACDNGEVYVGNFNDGSALYCPDGQYETVIYCYGGSLRELYRLKGAEFSPDAGEALVKMDSILFEDMGSGLIRASCTRGGDSGSVSIYLRADKDGAA